MGLASLRNNSVDPVEDIVTGTRLTSKLAKKGKVSPNRSSTFAGSEVISTSLSGTKFDMESMAVTKYLCSVKFNNGIWFCC